MNLSNSKLLTYLLNPKMTQALAVAIIDTK